VSGDIRKTVLIVEDDEATQSLLCAVLRRCGLDSVIAANGLAAIELLDARDDFACILLDLMMPVHDGTSVLSHLAARERRVPVIVCTAAVPITKDSFDHSLVCAVIRKPFDVEQLSAAVLALVK
jgi:CheY-like chemotaxis protein